MKVGSRHYQLRATKLIGGARPTLMVRDRVGKATPWSRVGRATVCKRSGPVDARIREMAAEGLVSSRHHVGTPSRSRVIFGNDVVMRCEDLSTPAVVQTVIDFFARPGANRENAIAEGLALTMELQSRLDNAVVHTEVSC